MKVKCAYHLCNKEVEEKEVVKKELRFQQGNQFVRESRNYCSEQCAIYNQMAHEL